MKAALGALADGAVLALPAAMFIAWVTFVAWEQRWI